MFKSITEKSYNLELVVKRLERHLAKKDTKINEKQLSGLVNTVAVYYKNKFKSIPEELYKGENKDLLDLAKEDENTLRELFEIGNLYQLLDLTSNYEKEKFKKDDDFRRQVMRIVLYETIEQNGKGAGAEYGLVFAKIFNFDLSIPMLYASYDGMFDERFLKFYDTYLGIGGSPYAYWLPNYFDENNHSRYDMEDLSDLTPQLKKYIDKKKINSKK